MVGDLRKYVTVTSLCLYLPFHNSKEYYVGIGVIIFIFIFWVLTV